MFLNELQLEVSKKHLSDVTTWISSMESEDQCDQCTVRTKTHIARKRSLPKREDHQNCR